MTVMTHEDLMSRSGATWCDEHSRWECAANTSRPHHATAMRGQAYCRLHVGMTTELAKRQGEVNLAAWRAQGQESTGPVDLGATVLEQLRLAVMRADLYGELLRLQYDDEGYGGLVGATHAAGRDGARVETGETVRALAKLEGEWRDRVVRFAKTAHEMGIDERHIEIEQARAQIVISAISGAVEDLDADVRGRVISRFLERIGRGELVGGEADS